MKDLTNKNSFALKNAIGYFEQNGLNRQNARLLAALFLEYPDGLSAAGLKEYLADMEENKAEQSLSELAAQGYLVKTRLENNSTVWKINPDFIVGQLKRQLHSISGFRSVLREVIILSKSETDAYEQLHEFTAAYINQVNNLIHNWYEEQK